MKTSSKHVYTEMLSGDIVAVGEQVMANERPSLKVNILIIKAVGQKFFPNTQKVNYYISYFVTF